MTSNEEASLDTEVSGDESDTAKTADETEGEAKSAQQDEIEGTTSSTSARKPRKRKRRIRLTDQGLKAKRKAERREKMLADKKTEVTF